MQGNVIVGDADAFRYLAYPPTNNAVRNYIERQFTNSSVFNQLTDKGREYFERAKALSINAFEKAKSFSIQSVLNKVNATTKGNGIYSAHTVEDLQSATPLLCRYVMSEETIRQYFHQLRISGYGEHYYDAEPNVSGEKHYDYRRVMNGIITADDDRFYSTEFIEDLYPTDRDLTPGEQFRIIRNQELALTYLLRGVDPTNQFGGEVG